MVATIGIPDATEVGVESNQEGVVGMASRLWQHSKPICLVPSAKRPCGDVFLAGAAVTNKDLPNNAMNLTRSAWETVGRGPCRLLPC